MNGELDIVGCGYGRKTREMFEKWCQKYTETTARYNERLQYDAWRFNKIENDIEKIKEALEAIQKHIYWLIGAGSVVGTILGNIIFFLLRHYIGG